MRKKRATTSVIARFCDALDLPLVGSPLVFLSLQFHRRASMCPPTSLWKGEGRVRMSSGLCVPGCRWLSPHPSIEGRGSWPDYCGWLRASCGGEVVARVVVVVAE